MRMGVRTHACAQRLRVRLCVCGSKERGEVVAAQSSLTSEGTKKSRGITCHLLQMTFTISSEGM